MKNLYLIRVNENYVEYLKQYDSKVQDNLNEKKNKPYLSLIKRSCDFKLLEAKSEEFSK